MDDEELQAVRVQRTAQLLQNRYGVGGQGQAPCSQELQDEMRQKQEEMRKFRSCKFIHCVKSNGSKTTKIIRG